MSLPPHSSPTDTQPDSLGPLLSHSTICLRSPQPFQILSLTAQTLKLDADFLVREAFYGDNRPPYELDLDLFSLPFLGSEVAEHNSHLYGSHSPSAADYPPSYRSAASEYDDVSTPPLSDSPATIPQMIWPTCICGCGGGPCLIQRPYRRPKGDPLEDDRWGELITFQVHGQCGMRLRDAYRCKYNGLSGRDDPMFVGSRTSISIRIEWPNCSSWAQQMRTKDWKRKPSPITKSKLATEVSKKVLRFLEDMARNRRGDTSPPFRVDFDRIFLVALEHVSLASWQPHLRFV
ncbi:hypothetical protein BJ322DRAFT_87519 [Thelephora terrestris]|uniref:Uncharacterized protein n=1 Tax=Thelephora terrestris TaxID=56493 RepID=A0A9P6HQS7_9AGAM|nr:hypothetical protein BJ322DRAFT_87519 [Thelephora terrestris]